jgi:integrase
MLNDRDAGVIGAGTQTVETYLNDWLATTLPRRRSGGKPITAKTITGHTNAVRLHIIPGIGRTKIQKLTIRQVEGLWQQMADDDLSRSTISHVRDTLNMALDHAVKYGEVPKNVSRFSDLPVTRPAAEPQALTLQQARSLVAFLESSQGDERWDGYRYAAAYIAQLHLGLRPGEVLGLKWDDIDLEGATLSVVRAIQVVDHFPILGATKTPGSVRTLRLAPVTVAALRAHRDRQAVEREDAAELWQEFGLVFPTGMGTITDPIAYGRSFKRACKAAGLGEDWTPRLLRHTFTSLGRAAGVSATVLADHNGHSLRMTNDVYSLRVEDVNTGVAGAIDSMFGDDT